MSETLKPCPFCGCEAAISKKYEGCPGFVVYCTGCGMGEWLGEGYGESGLADRWNTRTPGPATAAMLKHTRDWIKAWDEDGHDETPDVVRARAFLAEHGAA